MILKKLTFYILLITLFFTSCDSNVEVNVPFIEPALIANFQVDFDDQTWVAALKTATIINGIVTITATRNEGKETVIINLLNDQVNSYVISTAENVGSISYNNTEEEFGFFESNPELLGLGRIDLEINDVENQLLTGKFFFNGTMSIQQFEDDGITPITEEVINEETGEITFENVFITETKEFTNGIFENIVYTTSIVDPDPDPEPTDNEFTVAIESNDGSIDNFVATNITAIKANGYITVTGVRDQEAFTLTMPDDINNNNHLLFPAPQPIPNPDGDSYISYINGTTSEIFVPLTTNSVVDRRLSIDPHNTTTNKITGIFEFLGTNTNLDTLRFVGSFTVTYTE